MTIIMVEIRKVRIENFKGIKSLEFYPGDLNLIVGRNNVGKTSLLEALRLFFTLQNSKSILYQLSYPSYLLSYGADKGLIEINNKKIEFFRDEKTLIMLVEKLRKTLEKKIPKYIKSKKASKLSTEKLVKIIAKNYVIARMDKKLALILDLNLFLRPSFHPTIFFMLDELSTPIEPHSGWLAKTSKTFPLLSPKYLDEEILSFKEAKRKEDIEFLLKIEGFIKKYKLLDKFERFQNGFIVIKEGKVIPAELFGDGFLQFLILLFYLEKSEKIALLDEPTAFMHPGYIENFVKYLVEISKAKKIQIFIATHDIDLIESFLEYPEKKVRSSLKILRLNKVDDTILSTTLDYSEAVREKEKLKMDLRGV